MKIVRTLLGAIVLVIISCSKTNTTSTPAVVEQSIKFSTNYDTSSSAPNLIDTLTLSITVTSLFPTSGVIYSVLASWIDSSKTIYKIDSASAQSSISLRIPGFNKVGNYSVQITVTSKSTLTNTATKTLSFTDNPLARFQGYKVNQTALAISKLKDFGKSYWQNNPVAPDLMIDIFQKNLNPVLNGIYAYSAFSTAICLGDFNNDGYIDVFNAGAAYNGQSANLSFLIWDTISKTFKEQNLLNNKTNFIGGPYKVVPVYLNQDNYVDLVIFGHRDEGNPNSPNEPITLAISDGKGGYDLTQLTSLIPPELLHFTIEGGDVGDVNGDGIPDLFLTCNSHTYIFLGSTTYPYFSPPMFAHFASDTVNFHPNNGFGEVVYSGAGAAYNARISDVTGDGKNDLLICFGENRKYNIQQNILINKGGGRFNETGVYTLPYLFKDSTDVNQIDYVTDDLNGDGLIDIIALNTLSYSSWNIVVYIQQTNGTFIVDNSWINYTINTTRTSWKVNLVYYDFDGDGKKDIGYTESALNAYFDPTNALKNKTVFIRTGNTFVEKDFYQFDPYAKSLKDLYFK